MASSHPALIAEVKKASPSRGIIRPDFDPVAIAKAYENAGATCLSVLTDGPSFMGHESYLHNIRSHISLPLIRKDFLVDPWQIRESRAMGADAILIIMAMIDDHLAHDLYSESRHYDKDALVEVHDCKELERALQLNAQLIGINNRNLKSFEVDLNLSFKLRNLIPDTIDTVSESGIFTHDHVRSLSQAGFTAMLVGESLMRQANIETATRDLLAIV